MRGQVLAKKYRNCHLPKERRNKAAGR